MVEGPDTGKEVKVGAVTCFFGCDEKIVFCGVSKEGKDARGKLNLEIANSQVARERGSRVVDESLLRYVVKEFEARQTHRHRRCKKSETHTEKQETRCINAENGRATETIYNCNCARNRGVKGGHIYARLVRL